MMKMSKAKTIVLLTILFFALIIVLLFVFSGMMSIQVSSDTDNIVIDQVSCIYLDADEPQYCRTWSDLFHTNQFYVNGMRYGRYEFVFRYRDTDQIHSITLQYMKTGARGTEDIKLTINNVEDDRFDIKVYESDHMITEEIFRVDQDMKISVGP